MQRFKFNLWKFGGPEMESKSTLRRILLIQDDPSDAEAVQQALRNSSEGAFEIEWVRSCSEGSERLVKELTAEKHHGECVAAVLADLFLPDCRGIETFDRLFRVAPQTPFLILSAPQDETTAKLAVQKGAQDYVLKNRIDGYTLPKAVTGMVERAANAEALFDEKERAQVTLNSIGDAVISTDVSGNTTFFNVVAENLTGWPWKEALGRPLEEVFRIIDEETRNVAQNPVAQTIRENRAINLIPDCVLIRRDGTEVGIEDSCAPIHNRRGHVTGAVMVFRDVSAARAQSLQTSYLAQHDSLTNLPNRIVLNDRLTQAMALAHRHLATVALLFMDVDRFKHINDSLGHAIGDGLLQSVAQRLSECVRASDTVCRQGGDEFVVLLPEVRGSEDAALIAEKIIQAMSAPHRIDDQDIHITVTIGIATSPSDGTDADILIRNADFAMLSAKESGRNTYKFFKPEMNERAVERQYLESNLRDAMDRQEFGLRYQPKIDLRSAAIIGVEALIRWRHIVRGHVSPATFIPVAEESGLIVPIGRWVLREACRQARAWQDAGLPPTRMAVNISAVELRAKNFVGGVKSILSETRLEPRYLELELTETFLMQDSKSTVAVLEDLSGLGVRLALDDFGTGYSSLSYLKRFPIDTLKIDQSFVRDLATDPADASIVSAVIAMGKSLKMEVVAEGVETLDQLKFLRDQNCPEGQGYYFARPELAWKFAQLLKSGASEAVGGMRFASSG